MAGPSGNDDDITLSEDALQRISAAIATAVATAIASTPPSASPRPHSIALDPYDTSSFDVATKEGKYQWAIMTKVQDGWKPVSCTVDSADVLMDLFKDRQTNFGLDVLLQVPTAGNGRLQNAPRMLTGVEHWSADIREFKNLLFDIHSVSLQQG